MGRADRPVWFPVYVGLGSNLGDSPARIAEATVAMSAFAHTRLVAQSPLYRSRPLGPVAQADFVNAVAAFVSQLEPERWLRELKALERALGRGPTRVRWGPREIDLDLLVHGDAVRENDELSLPHPGIPEREFVLYPLRDIAADLRLGPLGTVRELAARIAPRGIEPIRP
jgi:2-amino-4-hydroxy-6-hydroxymethyldihydropteridine diphosphokinase